MIISKIQFKNFRNLNLTYEPSPGFNLILGENGAGKSNLLDAIYHLALGKTFKPYAITNNINLKSKAEFALISSEINDKDSSKELKIIFATKDDQERKRLEVNTKPTTRAKFTQNLDVILFAPHNINLLIGTPDIRRSEIDDFASLCDYKYATYIHEYQNIVRNRNRLLKSIALGEASIKQLSYWNSKLITLGSYIIVKRLTILDILKPLIKALADTYFKGELDGLELNYLSKFMIPDLDLKQSETDLIREIAAVYDTFLTAGIDKEINSKQSQYGPHKDDLEMRHEGNDLKLFGSRGQQRLATFMLKLAMWQYLGDLKHHKPIILLDDVMSELDARNRLRLEQIIANMGTQTFITTTHAGDYSENFRTQLQILNLE